jgi:hypothetical protein
MGSRNNVQSNTTPTLTPRPATAQHKHNNHQKHYTTQLQTTNSTAQHNTTPQVQQLTQASMMQRTRNYTHHQNNQVDSATQPHHTTMQHNT